MSWDPDFLSIEKLLKWYLEEHVLVPVTVELPHNFETDENLGMLPVIVIERISGADLTRTPILDRPVVDVDVYAANRAQAQGISETVRTWLTRRLQGRRIEIPDGAAVFGRTRTVVGPRNLLHNNPKVRRYNGSYEFLCHRQP